jgi:uncharacterized protein YbjQ (UPF0145 family)
LAVVLVLGVELALAAVQRLAVVLQMELAADTAAAELVSAAVQLGSEAVVPVSLPAMGHLVPAVHIKSVST